MDKKKKMKIDMGMGFVGTKSAAIPGSQVPRSKSAYGGETLKTKSAASDGTKSTISASMGKGELSKVNNQIKRNKKYIEAIEKMKRK